MVLASSTERCLPGLTQNAGLEVGVGIALGVACALGVKSTLDKDVAAFSRKAQASAAVSAPKKVPCPSIPEEVAAMVTTSGGMTCKSQ